MDEKSNPNSFTISSEENINSFYPMLFGVSCAFFALNLLPEPEICNHKCLEIQNRLLKCSAHLFGLLIWKMQKEEEAKKRIEELKKIRSEDGKANEKVVSIFAAQEQSWFSERKNLRHQIDTLTDELNELNEKLKETEAISFSKDKSIEEGERKRREIEENLRKAENHVNELRENLNREAQRHSNEILKHKTAFIELVSNQRQLEAEMGRVLRQLEQKDQILSAMLRKSKSDTFEKEKLLKEVKSSKMMRKQAEIETKTDRHSLRNMLSKRVNVKSDVLSKARGAKIDYHLEIERPDEKGLDESKTAADVEHLITSDAETHKIAIEQRRNIETDAFVEQLRLKDEKLEASRWRLLTTEVESKRLQSHIENLDHDITNLRQENMRLEALLMERESELHSLKNQLFLQFNPPNLQKSNFSPSPHETVWSKVKVIKRKPRQNGNINEISNDEQVKDIVLTLQYPQKEKQDKKSVDSDETSTSVVGLGSSKKGNSTLKLDIQALGVSYKIKRLKQQFLMLERLTGKQESSENEKGRFGVKGFYALISLLNKQADRYQSLQGKADDLCQRMHENNLNLNCGGTAIAKTEEETKRLEQFLEETFQLQRYIVATGQKLIEVQAKIACGFVNDAEKIEKPESFDTKRFADSIRMLFQEVQRGLEIRISRIIGDLGGTLACDGIIHFKK